MILGVLVILPLLVGLAAFLVSNARVLRGMLVLTALAHWGASLISWMIPSDAIFGGWIEIDAIGALIQMVASTLFLAAAVYTVGYLAREPKGAHRDFQEVLWFSNEPESVFVGCLLIFLSTMSAVACCQHIGLLWVAVEATTLASAPLIYFHRHHRSLEAAWKYLLLCSVGIALALFGNLLLVVSTYGAGGETIALDIHTLVSVAEELDPLWLKLAFIFFFIGYGTKMGLAPLHTWLPDAHSEAPSMVSALLSGALLNCAFLAILRVYRVCVGAGLSLFCQEIFIFFGLFSMLLAAVFILRQGDYKRLLAYSSVEHMGIMLLGIGLGGVGVFGSMFHLLNHSFAKAMLFLVAGNIVFLYQTKSTREVQGIMRALPVSGFLWILGFFAITGTPPFGTFLSEFTILRASLDGGHYLIAGIYLLLLAVIFVGMASVFIRMSHGAPARVLADSANAHTAESALTLVPAACLALVVLVLGIYVPSFVGQSIRNASNLLLGG